MAKAEFKTGSITSFSTSPNYSTALQMYQAWNKQKLDLRPAYELHQPHVRLALKLS